MFYQNFEHHITRMYRLTIEGWPLPKLCSPSSISSFAELEVLHRSWATGVARFRMLTDDEWKAYLNGIAEPSGDTHRDDTPAAESASSPDSTDRNTFPPAPTAPTVQLPVTTPVASTSAAVIRKRKAAPFTDFINTMSIDGTPVAVLKKPRQKRSDAGLRRGTRKNVASSGGSGLSAA
jgi:hypothetical protein